MDEASQFRELSGLLERAGIELRIEPFQTPPDSAGGLCYVFGKKVVLLDKNASTAERARALLEVIERVGLDDLGVVGSDLSPALLAALNRRGQMVWPHKSQAPSLAKTEARDKVRLRLVKAPPPLSHTTTMRLGGSPDQWVRASREEQVLEIASLAREGDIPLHILGGGSNVIVADAGVRGIVLHLETKGIEIERRGTVAWVTAQAGENWHQFVTKMTNLGFSGLECLAGIPGDVGASPIQNVGAYGQQVDSTIRNVRVLCRKTMQIRELDNPSCEFSYRDSIFKARHKDEFIVLSVTFELAIDGPPTVVYPELGRRIAAESKSGSAPTLRAVYDAVLALRKEKSMLLDPGDENGRSCGSFFVNAIVDRATADRISRVAGQTVPTFPVDARDDPGGGGSSAVKVPAAWLIERSGFLRGFRLGNAGLSTKHALCIVALPKATSRDVIVLAKHVRDRVESKFGVRLVPEPNFWGFSEMDSGLPV